MSLLLKSSVRQLTNIRLFSTSSLTLKHISNADQLKFKESKEGSKIVLVDFYAEVLSKVLEKVVPDNHSSVDLMTVNTDDQYELAGQFKIAALPTVIAFKGGEQIGKFVGVRTEDGVKDFLTEIGAQV